LFYIAAKPDIHHLFVAQDHRGRGVGTALTAVKHHANTHGVRLIGTDPDNATAIAAYRVCQIWKKSPALTTVLGQIRPAKPIFASEISPPEAMIIARRAGESSDHNHSPQ
jgi:GNAT superfamily N-acetyltransferase